MFGRIVEIASDGGMLRIERGFLVVASRESEAARLPIDDIGAVIGNAYGLVYTANVLTGLAERGIPTVLCTSNHRPCAVVWPVESHFDQATRINAQASARRPLKKALWKELVQEKVRQQARVLEGCEKSHKVVRRLVPKVLAGDPTNVEARAARHYWRSLFGRDFRRDPASLGVNSLLNYGYAILRAATARAAIAVGLHPSLGIFHRSGQNAFQLVDDLMEPFRPLVDAAVLAVGQAGHSEVTIASKRRLATLMYRDFESSVGRTPLARCIQSLAGC